MFDRMKGMADWRSIGLKALVYVLLLVSFVTFGKGWLTFESSRTRRNIQNEAKDMVEEMDNISDSDWESLSDTLADYDLDVSAEDFVKRVKQFGEVLEDAEISPKEAGTLMSSVSWLGNKAGELAGLGDDADTRKMISQARIYSILLRILYIVTIICFLGSLLALVTSAGIGTHAFSIMVIFQFVIFVVAKLRMDKFMDEILGSLGGVSSENMAMKLCAPAFVSLICAVLASVVWVVLQYLCSQEGKAVPNLLSLYKKGTKGTRGAGPILPREAAAAAVCVCGAKLDKNAKFCAVCGRKVSDMMPARSVCRYCGAELEPGSLFCPECGQKVGAPAPVRPEPAPAPVCPKCGSPVEPGALFCGVCGTKIAAAPAPASTPAPADNGERTYILEPAPASLGASPKTLILTSMEDSTKQFSRQLADGQSLFVGRAQESDIVVDFNSSVSRKHCSIFMENGEVYVKDEGSSYSTYVNEQIANNPLAIHTGDTLTLGNCKLYVSIQ